jgi:DNA invertase Pin-like site-specific DNA recombinase
MKKRGKKTPVVEYLRVSGLGQVEGDGKTRQKESNKVYAETHGYKIEQSWFDGGVSGCNDIDDREALTELIDYVTEKNIQIVLVEGADRLARDLLISETILARFRELGCKVVESRSGNDLTNAEDNPTKELVTKILSVVSMWEKKTLQKKLAAARKRKREATGKCEGRKAYGEDSAEEREILAMARTLRRKPKNKKQKSYAAVAAALTAQGHTNRRGGDWTSQSVRNILVS